MRSFILIILLSLPLTSDAFGEESMEVTEEVPTVTARQVVVEHARAHLDLHKHGVRYRFTKERKMVPLHVDVEGPVHHGTILGFKVVVRF